MAERKLKTVKDIKRIGKLLADHYNGNPWIDMTIVGTLKGITAKKAAAKYRKLNSIWQIVNHMILWRRALIARVMDTPVSAPNDNFISEIKDTSPASWKRIIKDFESSQKEITSFLLKQDDRIFDKISPASGYSYYELTAAILLHDTYHLGQIVLIKKLLK